MTVRRHLPLAMLAAALSAEAAQAQSAATPQAPATGTSGTAAGPAERGFDVLFDEPGITLPRGWTVDFSGPLCPSCPTRWSPGVTNGNAPWHVSSTVAWQGADASAALGLTAQRNARLPLYMAPGGSPAHVASASEALLSDPGTRLTLTLGGERVVWRSGAGATLSLFSDLYVPVGTIGRGKAAKDVTRGSNLALINGVRVRF